MSEGLSIRDAIEEDAAELASAERAIARVPGKLASRPDEIHDAALRQRIADFADRRCGIFLVASPVASVASAAAGVSGRAATLIGHAWLEPIAPVAMVAHVVRLTIAVHEGHQGRGVGRALMNELLAWARSNPRVDKVELQVRATNAPAIALYRSLGFVEEGRKTRRLKVGPNEYIDDVYMALWVGRGDVTP
jgi:ribosomal protein S18 acetylase RimI-like enzyme